MRVYLSTNLALLREKKGLTQSEIASGIGFGTTTWNNYERGISKPNLDDFVKICRLLRVTPSELLLVDMRKGDFCKNWQSRFSKAKSDYLSDYSSDFSEELQMVAEAPTEFVQAKKVGQNNKPADLDNDIKYKELQEKIDKIEAMVTVKRSVKKKK